MTKTFIFAITVVLIASSCVSLRSPDSMEYEALKAAYDAIYPEDFSFGIVRGNTFYNGDYPEMVASEIHNEMIAQLGTAFRCTYRDMSLVLREMVVVIDRHGPKAIATDLLAEEELKALCNGSQKASVKLGWDLVNAFLVLRGLDILIDRGVRAHGPEFEPITVRREGKTYVFELWAVDSPATVAFKYSFQLSPSRFSVRRLETKGIGMVL